MDLWRIPKEAFRHNDIQEIIVTPDNMCPKCSSETGLKINVSYLLGFWKCKNCNFEWMTIND